MHGVGQGGEKRRGGGVQLESRRDSKKVVECVNGKVRERNNRDVVG